MQHLVPFQFENYDIRVVTDEEGNPWWVLADVCAALGLTNPSEVAKRIESSNLNTLSFSEGIAGNPSHIILNESGLYEVIFRSNKAEAKVFRQWVFSEVLPQIRKTGKYETLVAPQIAPPAPLSMPLIESFVDLLERLGELGDRDRLMASDAARTVLSRASGVPLLPENTKPGGFDIEDALRAIAPQLTAKQVRSLTGTLGKRIAAEYRERFKREPGKQRRFVDGKTRDVNWYRSEDADWVYPIIQGFLAGLVGHLG